jgi:hypothetical protein
MSIPKFNFLEKAAKGNNNSAMPVLLLLHSSPRLAENKVFTASLW